MYFGSDISWFGDLRRVLLGRRKEPARSKWSLGRPGHSTIAVNTKVVRIYLLPTRREILGIRSNKVQGDGSWSKYEYYDNGDYT